jgi:hypothetical protein
MAEFENDSLGLCLGMEAHQCRWIKRLEICREASRTTSNVYMGQATTIFSSTPTMLTQPTLTLPWRNTTDSWMPSGTLGAPAFPDGCIDELTQATPLRVECLAFHRSGHFPLEGKPTFGLGHGSADKLPNPLPGGVIEHLHDFATAEQKT